MCSVMRGVYSTVCTGVEMGTVLCVGCRYGVVLKELGSRGDAREAQLTSISLQPLFWGAWSELAILCEDREMVREVIQL